MISILEIGKKERRYCALFVCEIEYDEILPAFITYFQTRFTLS